MEIGGPEKRPIILTDQHVRLMAEQLPAQCHAMFNDAYCIFRDGDSIMNTARGYLVARMSLGIQYVFFELHELRYLSYIFLMVRNQLTHYTQAMHDVMNYIATALQSDTYVELSINANKADLYYQLFEDLKSIV